jgi:hypothetical protein
MIQAKGRRRDVRVWVDDALKTVFSKLSAAAKDQPWGGRIGFSEPLEFKTPKEGERSTLRNQNVLFRVEK